MSRTLICLQQLVGPDAGKQVIFRIEEPDDVPDFDVSRILDDGPGHPSLDFLTRPGAAVPGEDAPVQAAGLEVYRRLAAHRGVERALERAATAAADVRHPIHIETSSYAAEVLPWEVMFLDGRGFLALDARWPIARLAGRRAGRESVDRLVHGKVRICAVLAAADRDATPEWEALYAALKGSSVECELLALVCQTELRDHIAALGDASVQVAMVPGGPTGPQDLIRGIAGFEPNLLHFFCHGSAEFGGHLEIASRNTRELGEEPIFLNASQLAPATAQALLVTLDACEGAMPTAAQDSHSLAYTLVKDGVPAAVGMRRAIDTQAAHLFCGAFFTEVMAMLATLRPAQEVEIDWAPAMRGPRERLCARHPGPLASVAAKHAEWTLPVLYRRPEPLRVTMAAEQIPEDPEFLFGMLETLRAQRAAMHPDTPAETLQKLDRLIEEVRLMLHGAGG